MSDICAYKEMTSKNNADGYIDEGLTFLPDFLLRTQDMEVAVID